MAICLSRQTCSVESGTAASAHHRHHNIKAGERQSAASWVKWPEECSTSAGLARFEGFMQVAAEGTLWTPPLQSWLRKVLRLTAKKKTMSSINTIGTARLFRGNFQQMNPLGTTKHSRRAAIVKTSPCPLAWAARERVEKFSRRRLG